MTSIDDDDPWMKEKSLAIFFLSTGAHPSILSDPQRYQFYTDSSSYSWARPKTRRPVIGVWSQAMRQDIVQKTLSEALGTNRFKLYHQLSALGRHLGIQCVGPLLLRHTNYVDRARLGHHILDIAHSTGTNMYTVYRYYTVGIQLAKATAEEDKNYLRWLIEP